MKADQSFGAHSAQVKMCLIVNGAPIRITHMGPDFLLVDALIDEPPGQATILLQVDQNESRWQVNLPEGISKASRRVALAPCEQAAQE